MNLPPGWYAVAETYGLIGATRPIRNVTISLNKPRQRRSYDAGKREASSRLNRSSGQVVLSILNFKLDAPASGEILHERSRVCPES